MTDAPVPTPSDGDLDAERTVGQRTIGQRTVPDADPEADDDGVTEASEESFPASDPPSTY